MLLQLQFYTSQGFTTRTYPNSCLVTSQRTPDDGEQQWWHFSPSWSSSIPPCAQMDLLEMQASRQGEPSVVAVNPGTHSSRMRCSLNLHGKAPVSRQTRPLDGCRVWSVLSCVQPGTGVHQQLSMTRKVVLVHVPKLANIRDMLLDKARCFLSPQPERGGSPEAPTDGSMRGIIGSLLFETGRRPQLRFIKTAVSKSRKLRYRRLPTGCSPFPRFVADKQVHDSVDVSAVRSWCHCSP